MNKNEQKLPKPTEETNQIQQKIMPQEHISDKLNDVKPQIPTTTIQPSSLIVMRTPLYNAPTITKSKTKIETGLQKERFFEAAKEGNLNLLRNLLNVSALNGIISFLIESNNEIRS